MKQLQRIVTLALALSLIGAPAVTLAQTSPSSPAPSGTSDKAKPAMDKPSTPSASPSTTAPSNPSMKAPMSVADCQNNGWQKFGLKSEAECTAKLKK